MKKFLVGLFLLVSIGAKAQDSHKVSLKLYSQLQHSTGFSSNMNITNGQNALVTSTFRNTKLSMLPGVKLQSSAKISHELSLTGLDWERNESLTEVAVGGSVIPTAGNNSNEFIIGLRYEFGYSLPVLVKIMWMKFEADFCQREWMKKTLMCLVRINLHLVDLQ